MVDKNLITQRNGADEDVIRSHIHNALVKMHTSIPAKIVSINATEQTVDAMPVIQRVFNNEDGTQRYENYPLIKSCPIIFIQGGNFIITTPIAVGDNCLLFFSEKCIDNWWQTGANNNRPFEFRSFDLSDGFALVGVNNLVTKISNYDTTNLVIRTKDNSKYIKCMTTGFEILGDTKIVGKLEVTDSAKFDSTVVATTSIAAPSVLANGKELTNHKHTVPLAGALQPVPIPDSGVNE